MLCINWKEYICINRQNWINMNYDIQHQHFNETHSRTPDGQSDGADPALLLDFQAFLQYQFEQDHARTFLHLQSSDTIAFYHCVECILEIFREKCLCLLEGREGTSDLCLNLNHLHSIEEMAVDDILSSSIYRLMNS